MRCSHLPLLLSAVVLFLLGGCYSDFCETFCGKCDRCYERDESFEEDDCTNRAMTFSYDTCRQQCEVGTIPLDLYQENFPVGWELQSCDAFDDML